MGESCFTLKAKFPTLIKTEVGINFLQLLVTQSREADNYWQNNRDTSTTKQIISHIDQNFPLVGEVLDYSTCYNASSPKKNISVRQSDSPDALCGLLDYSDLDNKPADIVQERTTVDYSAKVWYWARWVGLAKWLISKGASKVTWTNPQGTFTESKA